MTDTAVHYDTVTDAWAYILGDNLHYGYFTTGTESLDEATDALIDRMAGLAEIGASTSVLDVGCGTGHPAFHLHRRTGCRVSGISISRRGIEIADRQCRAYGFTDRVSFVQRDALDNGFPDGVFDVAWVMESSHLMRDKPGLFAETFRVLKPGGTMLLCDLILKQAFTVPDLYRYRDALALLERSFGKAKMETLDAYRAGMLAQGFDAVETQDITRAVVGTFARWEANMDANREALAAHFREEQRRDFRRSCEVLTGFFRDGLLGYGIVKACKPPAITAVPET